MIQGLGGFQTGEAHGSPIPTSSKQKANGFGLEDLVFGAVLDPKKGGFVGEIHAKFADGRAA